MVPWNHFSNHQSLFAEVDQITDVDVLKEVAKKLIKDNHSLTRKTKIALASVENQNQLIKDLQENIARIMALYSQQAKELWSIIGTETLRSFDNVMRYQAYISDLSKYQTITESDSDAIKKLLEAAFSVPPDVIKIARARCVHFLGTLSRNTCDDIPEENIETQYSCDDIPEENIETQYSCDDIPEENIEIQYSKPRRKFTSVEIQNGRITLGRNRKQHYRIMAKKNACRTSRKHAFNKSQNDKTENNAKKNSRYAKSANGEMSQSDTEDIRPKKFPRRRRHKRKAEEMNDESSLKSDNENSANVNKIPVKKTEPTKKMRNTQNYSTSNSIEETIQLKPLVIKLNDFMTDPSADNDQYVAQYKQAHGYKGNEEEFQIVDDVDDDDADSGQKAESEQDSDNNEEEDNQEDIISTRLHESEDNVEQDSTASDGENQPPRSVIPNGKKGPRTPPLSPAPYENIFRRGPRTPSHSPPSPRRGPRTPPGCAPTSDSEATDDDGDSSDCSTLSTAY